jgi:hypothetical protein
MTSWTECPTPPVGGVVSYDGRVIKRRAGHSICCRYNDPASFRKGDIVNVENDRVLNRATTSTIEAFKANDLVVKSAAGDTSKFVRML